MTAQIIDFCACPRARLKPAGRPGPEHPDLTPTEQWLLETLFLENPSMAADEADGFGGTPIEW